MAVALPEPQESRYHHTVSMTSLPSVERRPGVTRSLVGQKAVMAVTGVILFLFVVAHLLGNLKIFEGPEAFNAYAEGLRTVGAPFFGRGWLLWIARIVLIVAVLALHLYHGTWSALQTLGLNRPPTGRWRRGAAAAIAVLIAGGYISIPVAVLAGMLH